MTPDSINVAAKSAVSISVVELTCADSRRTIVYPVMSVADTSVAFVSSTHRMLYSRAKGSTTLSLTDDSPYATIIVRIPVVVR